MHLLRADLHLEGNALVPDDGGVQTLVAVGLRRGDIVLEPAGHQLEHLMDVPEDVVALGDRVHDDPEGIEIVQLVQRLVLLLHLAVDRIDVLDPPGDRATDVHLTQPVAEPGLDVLHKGLRVAAVGVQVVHQTVVAIGVEILQGVVLQLPLDLLHAQTVRQRRENVHRLSGLGNLLGRGLVLHRALVVQTVADFNQHHADVLGHCHEHLAQILDLLLLHRGEFHAGQLGDALDQLGHGVAKETGNVVKGRGGVLDAVVEQGAENRVGIQTDLRHDLRDREGVNNIGGAVLPLLILVLFNSILNRPFHRVQVGVGRIAANGLHHGIVMFLEGLHSGLLSCSL